MSIKLNIKNLLYYKGIAVMLLLSASSYAFTSPFGYWKTIDDKTNIAKSILEIKQRSGGEVIGKVIKVLHTEDGSDPETRKCDKCTGKLKNKTIKGMTVMWGLKKDGDEWNGGEIVDPSTGSIYSVKMSLANGGKELNVRGYLGFSLFGRTQVWYRLSESEKNKYLS